MSEILKTRLEKDLEKAEADYLQKVEEIKRKYSNDDSKEIYILMHKNLLMNQ